MCVSNPLIHVVDTLSRLSHDNDKDVSLNACLALGLVGAGTNNARLAQMLRQLATYYAKEPSHIILVRVAQGLLHAGKGTLSLRPYHTDRFLLSPVALSGLLATVVAMMDNKQGQLLSLGYEFAYQTDVFA
jgi:26S proteasome regulatory subunit N1